MKTASNSVRCLLLLILMMVAPAWAFEPFVIEEIEVEGLQRIDVGTVFNYLPFKKGDTFTPTSSTQAIRELFNTGFFQDVLLEREGNRLIVFVKERPSISSIEIDGNESIPEEQLRENLKGLGFAEGRVFERALLDKIEQELKRQYLILGKYNARVETEVEALERNRVAVTIKIGEGDVASIKHINIVGNDVFDERELLDQLQLGVVSGLAFFSSRDQYSRQALTGDLETLRSYYMNRGYINFAITSTQVSITPDKKGVYITINISEGEKFHIKSVDVSGKTIVGKDELMNLINVEPGQAFSRDKILQSANNISERLGDEGYAFANVNPMPDVDAEAREIALTFFVDPGKRTYVRRIDVSGNLATADNVVRREMRQLESTPISTKDIKRSQTRIQRLGYFTDVSVKTPSVIGAPDMVDVKYALTERETFGSFNLGVGYGDTQGFVFSTSLVQENFMGTGQKLSLELNTSSSNTVYSVSFTDPYYTQYGVSRTLRAYVRETDPSEVSTGDYTTDSHGLGVRFGVPVSEYVSYNVGIGYDFIRLNLNRTYASNEIIGFCEQNATLDECEFGTLKTNAGISYDSRNKTVFPDSGNYSSFSGEISNGISDHKLDFYKFITKTTQFLPVTKSTTFSIGGEIGYGDSFNDTSELPPFESFFAGGSRSVRGYRRNSIGPEDSNGDALGGNARVLVKAEYIFPAPFDNQQDSMRLSAFIDGGNVYNTDVEDIDLNELRYSNGVSLVWLTPVGPMSFSWANAMNPQEDDETESFQFTLGTLF